MRSVIIKRGQTRYRIFPNGQVWSMRHRIFLKPDVDKDGYYKVTLGGKVHRLARLILTCFDRKPRRGEQARHLDGDPSRNNIGNLEWGTSKQNWKDRKRHKRINSGRLNLKPKHIRLIKTTPKPWPRGFAKQMAEAGNVTIGRIYQIANGYCEIQTYEGKL